MRLAVCALSAVLLSGCSWLGGLGQGGQAGGVFGQSSQLGGQYGGQRGAFAGGRYDPCVVYSPRAPIPRGSQQPHFGGGNYANAGFGSHVGVAGQQAANYQPRRGKRKPKLRGALSLGFEKSTSGDLLDYSTFTGFNPEANYDPNDYNEGFVEGSPESGAIETTLFTAIVEDVDRPNISFDDVHSTPFSVKGGLEYILSPKTTVFANGGFAQAEGESGTAIGINGELRRRVTTENFRLVPAVTAIPGIPAIPAIPATPSIPGIPANPLLGLLGTPGFPGSPGSPGSPGTPGVPGIPEQIVPDGVNVNVGFVPNRNIANYIFNFSDQRRIDLEVGGRHYFNPIVKNQGFKTLTPFVGASVGASHHNALSVDVSQNQLFYQRAFEAEAGEAPEFYDVVPPNVAGNTRVDLYDSQWVPTGQLNAGVEWQVTPKTALAFESGLRFEGARKYTNGVRGDTNIAVPFTVRGSYNF